MALSTEEQLELPHEPGAWIRVQYPGFVLMEKSRHQRILQQVELYRAAGDVLSKLPSAETPTDPGPLNEFHIATLLEGCIVGWSYDAPVDAENIAKLDEETVRFVAERLVAGPSTPASGRKKS